MILTYKYRIKDRSARKVLAQYAYAVNQVWNYCNAVQKDIEARYRAGAPERQWPSDFDLQKRTAGTSRELGINSQTVQEVCRQYARSRDKANHSLRFRASGGPRRALGWVPFTSQCRQIEGNSIQYLGHRFRWFGNKRRPLPDKVKGGSFVEDSLSRWYVCFHVEVEDLLPAQANEIGIDLGLKTLVTCSNGVKIPAFQYYRQYEAKLMTAQRARNKKRVRAIHAKIANTRKDQHHKVSANLTRQNQLIVVGNVSAAKLVKTQMAKSVLDAGWSQFRTMLRYKARRHGATYIEVDEKFTSQICSECGSLPVSRPKGIADLGIRVWKCSECGALHDRDVNAAQNILRLGQSALPLAGESRKAA